MTPVTAANRALELIRLQVADGTLKPGDRLPDERALSADLGVSRSALREAVRALELVGVLRSRHGSGTYVTALQPGDLLPVVGFAASMLTVTSAVDVAEFRRLIEPPTAAMATSRATPEQVERLGEVYEEMERTTEPGRYAELDAEFHGLIVEAGGNAVVTAVHGALAAGEAWHRMWKGVTQDFVPERTRRDHHDLLTALQTGDAELALAVSHSHIANAQRRIAVIHGVPGAREERPTAGA